MTSGNNFKLKILIYTAALLLVSCSNNPYSGRELTGNHQLRSYSEDPKYLDPVRSYYTHEAAVIDQAYEFLLEYHYLKRPYELIPCLAEKIPQAEKKEIIINEPFSPRRYNASGTEIFMQKKINTVIYKITIKSNVFYAPNPCFSYNSEKGVNTREMTSADFLYAWKRICDPLLSCPVFPVLSGKIYGMREFYEYQKNLLESGLDSDYSFLLSGFIIHNRYEFSLVLTEPYPQILYWFAMHFTSPMPEEAMVFYKKQKYNKLPPGIRRKTPFYLQEIIGTGPYMLTSWKKRQEIVMIKNPLFRPAFYPVSGMTGDQEAGLLADAGKQLPFIDALIMKYEPASVSMWNKFQQGYLDASGISKEEFGKAVISGDISPELAQKKITLSKGVSASIFYLGFNMLDPVVGGMRPEKKLLRQAISCAVNVSNYIKIFRNGRGIAPSSPIAPGIFGYNEKNSGYQGYNLMEGKRLLAMAGYKNGLDPRTGKPLVIRYDNASTGSAERPYLLFIKDQIEQLGIKIELASTDLNTYRQKISDGNYQIFESGWSLDYPDPENFLFLLHSSGGTVRFHGDNTANYENPEFDRLFGRLAAMNNTDLRRILIDQAVSIINDDRPWIYLFCPIDYILLHEWYKNVKLADVINNSAKYRRLDPEKRLDYVKKNNRPRYWPLFLFFMVISAAAVPAVHTVKRRYQ